MGILEPLKVRCITLRNAWEVWGKPEGHNRGSSD